MNVPVRIVYPMPGPDFPRDRGSDFGDPHFRKGPKPWARRFDRCQECRRTDRAHAGKGLCVNCKQNARNRRLREARP